MKYFYATRSYGAVMSLELVKQYISFDAAQVGKLCQEEGASVSSAVKKYEDKLFEHEEQEEEDYDDAYQRYKYDEQELDPYWRKDCQRERERLY